MAANSGVMLDTTAVSKGGILMGTAPEGREEAPLMSGIGRDAPTNQTGYGHGPLRAVVLLLESCYA